MSMYANVIDVRGKTNELGAVSKARSPEGRFSVGRSTS